MGQIGCIGHDGDCCKTRDQDVKDAERYRWLRDQDNQTRENSPCVSDESFTAYFGRDLDALIDAEICAKNE